MSCVRLQCLVTQTQHELSTGLLSRALRSAGHTTRRKFRGVFASSRRIFAPSPCNFEARTTPAGTRPRCMASDLLPCGRPFPHSSRPRPPSHPAVAVPAAMVGSNRPRPPAAAKMAALIATAALGLLLAGSPGASAARHEVRCAAAAAPVDAPLLRRCDDLHQHDLLQQQPAAEPGHRHRRREPRQLPQLHGRRLRQAADPFGELHRQRRCASSCVDAKRQGLCAFLPRRPFGNEMPHRRIAGPLPTYLPHRMLLRVQKLRLQRTVRQRQVLGACNLASCGRARRRLACCCTLRPSSAQPPPSCVAVDDYLARLLLTLLLQQAGNDARSKQRVLMVLLLRIHCWPHSAPCAC